MYGTANTSYVAASNGVASDQSGSAFGPSDDNDWMSMGNAADLTGKDNWTILILYLGGTARTYEKIAHTMTPGWWGGWLVERLTTDNVWQFFLSRGTQQSFYRAEGLLSTPGVWNWVAFTYDINGPANQIFRAYSSQFGSPLQELTYSFTQDGSGAPTNASQPLKVRWDHGVAYTGYWNSTRTMAQIQSAIDNLSGSSATMTRSLRFGLGGNPNIAVDTSPQAVNGEAPGSVSLLSSVPDYWTTLAPVGPRPAGGRYRLAMGLR